MTTTTIAANAVAAAHIQGLQAFMASEVKERATDAQLEAAAGGGLVAQLGRLAGVFKGRDV